MVVVRGYRWVTVWRFYVYDVPLRVIDGAQRIGELCCILFTPRTVEFVRLFFV